MAISWEDEGIILAVRQFGEHDTIVSLFTESQGRHVGLVKGGNTKGKRALLQQGNLAKAWWRARLDEQLGQFTLEPLRNIAAQVMTDADALAGLTSICAMVEATLPEREPHAAVYQNTYELLDALTTPEWEREYVRWEVALLRDMGYGLDLTACAATGSTQNLAFVSPRTGRAVSQDAAAPYIDRLLPLPAFLNDAAVPVAFAALLDGLRLTGHFFDQHVFAPHAREMPSARARLIARLRTKA